MSRAVEQWRASHDDQAIPDRVKARVFLKFDGHCPKCTRKLMPGQWACDHIVALINDGKHEEANLQPLCNSPCHSAKTRADLAIKSKTARRLKRDIGLPKKSRFQTAKTGPFKQKIGGRTERRI